MSNRNPFDFVKSVSYDKDDIMVDEVEEKAYVPYLTNRALSYHEDTLYFANVMNIKFDTPNRLQYVFFLNILRKRKRFSSWEKPKENDDIETIKSYYGVSTDKAKEYFRILGTAKCEVLKKSMDLGGQNNVRGTN